MNKPPRFVWSRSLGIRLQEHRKIARKLGNYSRYLTEIPAGHPPHTNQKVQRFRTTWILSDSLKLGINLSGTLRCRDWQLVTDVSEQCIGPFFRGEAVKYKSVSEVSELKYKCNNQSQSHQNKYTSILWSSGTWLWAVQQRRIEVSEESVYLISG